LDIVQDSASEGAMALPGIGFTSASCSAYSTMKGVMMPEVSAGSNQVGASETWTAQVIWPEGWAAAGAAAAVATATARANTNARERLMICPPLQCDKDPKRSRAARLPHFPQILCPVKARGRSSL
jgi:hypothetical protein